MRPHAACLSVFLFGLGSCKTPEPSSWIDDAVCIDAPSWESFAQGWLRTQCTSCHGSALGPPQRQGAPEGVNFDTYASTVSYGPDILVWAVGDSPPMPPAGQTNPDMQEQLAEWVQCGWPRSGRTPFDRCAEPAQTVLASEVTNALCLDPQIGLSILGNLSTTTAHACICEVQGDVDMQGPSEWPVLHTVTGSITSQGTLLSPNLELVEGSMNIQGTMEKTLQFPSLARVAGDLTFQDISVERLEWSVLDSVGGHLHLQDSFVSAVVSPHLQEIGGDITLATSQIETLNGFDSLGVIGGSLSFHDIVGLEKIEGFSQLASVENIAIEACPDLLVIDGFDALEGLEGALTLSELPALYYVGGWPSLTRVDGAFTIRDTALATLQPWPPLITTGAFTLEDQPLLTSMAQFDSLTHVFNDLMIRNTPLLELEHIEQWLKPIEVNGSISIE